uniref:Rx N-terminal domain-containing protein n=1 Tax=Fagus sylvatica TaxID=28930 RepID=A0A2N9HTC8_FAGSY
MAESAVSLVIENLFPLLVQEARLLRGIHGKVASIKAELEIIQSFLKDADTTAEKEDMSNVVKTWVKQVREEAYHTENVIDEYIRHFAKQPHGESQCFCFFQNVFHFTKKLKARNVIASKIQDISNNLKEKREMAVSYRFNTIEQGGPSNDAKSVTWHDPRVASLFIEEAEVVGIESHRNKLIDWLVELPSNHTVISVVGIGGVGKTTLVKKVYNNEKVAAHFDCCAWITVSQSYRMEKLFRDMIKQFYKARKEIAPKDIETMEEIKLIEVLRQYLHEQRYIAVFDDVWDTEFWGRIKLALPNNEKCSGILITTRKENVAPSHNESSSYYVHKQPPLPLEKAWELFCKKVFQLEGGNCPLELVELSRAIVEKCEGLPLAIVAIGGLLSTKDKNISSFDGNGRRLSIQNSVNTPLDSMTSSQTHLDSITSSQTRSILVLGVDEVPTSVLTTCFANFKLMKTMDFEGSPIDYIPKEVGNLFHLRYLSLRNTKVKMLPKSIGKLHNLETLDLKRSLVSKLPAAISGLHKLRYLVAYIGNNNIKFNIDSRQAVKIHSGIGCLHSLHKLFKIEANNTALIVELGSLRQLRKLEISKLKRENGIALCIVLEKMSHLQSLRINATSEEEVLELQSMSSPPPLLQTLILRGQLEKLPDWIPKLKSIVRIGLTWSRLMDDPLKYLQGLHNLMDLGFYDGYGGEQLHIEGGGFQKLKFLGFRNLRGLNRLIIDEDALPLIEKLEIGPCPQLKEGLKGKTIKCTTLVIQNYWSVFKVNSWRTKVPSQLSRNYRFQMPTPQGFLKYQIRQDTVLFSINWLIFPGTATFVIVLL